jgi:8-oxo-dGTP diphosphatase
MSSAKFTVAVAYVIERSGTVLVMRRSRFKDHGAGQWETGSGRLEYGETPEQALHREVLEETGLRVEIVRPVDTFHFYRGANREETVGITFWCRYIGGDVAPSEEHDRVSWVRFQEAIDLMEGKGMSRAIATIAESVRSAD